MPTIRVLPDAPHGFRAVAGGDQATGPTVGQALDRLTDRLGTAAARIVVQPQQPDEFFPADTRADGSEHGLVAQAGGLCHQTMLRPVGATVTHDAAGRVEYPHPPEAAR